MMHNLWMNTRRYRALVLAILPFIITGTLWFLMENDDSWGQIGYLMLLIASVPLAATMSVLSVFAAFNKQDPNRRFIKTTKVVSIASATVFVGLTLTGLLGAITSMLGIG